MSISGKTLKLCSCNGTIPVDANAIAAALRQGEATTVYRELCRKEVAAFRRSLADPEVLVACTQEAPLFVELRDADASGCELGFVNIRELAGWSVEGRLATPKIAALIAAAALPEPDPVPNVEYRSAGQVLVIGPSAPALDWAERLRGALQPSVLVTRGESGALPGERRYPVWSGKDVSVRGHLGAFEVRWRQANPIDLDLCTRCNACIDACPEAAIDFTYQIDLERCRGHRRCVSACGAVGAIDFAREPEACARSETFDMVLDLSPQPLVRAVEPPQGYLAPGADPLEQALAAARLAEWVGEFEKPRFFEYRAAACAHRRSGKAGCSNCLDVCSTEAITEDGDGVRVEPHLCAGCGGCATVCPSGAVRHAYPGVPYTGRRLKAALDTYREAGGRDACVVLHGAEGGRALVHGVGRCAVRGGRGLPARAIPIEVYHPAAIGIDLLLGALCYGAAQVVIVAPATLHAGYREALQQQIRIAESLLDGLGYGRGHFQLLTADDAAALEQALWSLPRAQPVAVAATFHLSAEKRTTLDFAVDHLARHAPQPCDVVPLPVGAPFGAVTVNRQTCTLCKACIGACPAAALQDAPDTPALRFIERNCLQCGLCARTCPEDAIGLVPRLLLGAGAKQPIVLHEAEPFHCVRCGKPFGTRQMVESMAGRLGSHGMFSGSGLRRLQMCADCRVVDMMENRSESTVFDVLGRKP